MATEATASAILTNDQIGSNRIICRMIMDDLYWDVLSSDYLHLLSIENLSLCHRESKSCDVPDNNLTDSFSSRPKSSRECARSLRMVVIMCWSRAFLSQQDVSCIAKMQVGCLQCLTFAAPKPESFQPMRQFPRTSTFQDLSGFKSSFQLARDPGGSNRCLE